ncbi:MAG: carboxylating nicotinate-nucleotide diphosphorylase [Mycetocola sp.]
MLTTDHITTLVTAALREDAPWGDITAEHLIPADATATAHLVSREDAVFSGGDLIRAAFTLSDSRCLTTLAVSDGDRIGAGQSLGVITGPARAVLTAERIALNFSQRMSGISTLTRRFVDAVSGTSARIVDTRKTTPGLRSIERHAVLAGGGHNHRRTLSDAVMVKDNHLAVLAAAGQDITDALRDLRARVGHTVHIEVEVDSPDQIPAVLAAHVDTIMLDNFSLTELRSGVDLINGRCLVEASGTVSQDRVAAIAATGVDLISVGRLTHSAPAIDIGLDIHIV